MRGRELKNLSWRLYVVPIVIIISVILVLPTVHMHMNNLKEPEIWPYKQINLGLDLMGGMHLVLEVDTEKYMEDYMSRMAQDLRDLLRKERIRQRGLTREKQKIHLIIRSEDKDAFLTFLDKEFGDLEHTGTTDNDSIRYTLKLPSQDIEHMKKQATEQALETIRNRIDEFGVREPDIRLQGKKRILVQLPGIEDPDRAKKLLGDTALLEFKLVDDVTSLSAAVKGNVPQDSDLLYIADTKKPIVVKKRAVLTGAYLTDAQVQINSMNNEIGVGFKLDKKGARIFAEITEKNIDKRLAIVLDSKVVMAPVIRSKIPGGRGEITGNFTETEAKDLAIKLRAGALPAPVKIIEERTVGPSLGHDSINKGLISMYVGLVFVLVFMLIYYKGAGLVADIALILNIILIAAGLSGLGATLTLPGIAGYILTIGMAVDANVLIFERIREELALGKTVGAAVTAGFDRATLTILDANITTLIAALVLLQFGTGPVKGFAYTLSLGIASSLFTALVFSRLIFDYFLVVRRVKTLSI